jgi:CheY-like chemotaxis protein
MVAMTKVLLVEDDFDARGAMADILRDAGYDVAEAGAGRMALQLATTVLPDIVLMDLMLPDTPGGMLLGTLRALPGAQTLPAVAVSGFPENRRIDGDGETSVRFNAYLEKPFSSAALLQVVATTLGFPSE